MSGTLGNSGASQTAPQAAPLAAPLAIRARRPGWRDPRLWVGILIVMVSVVAGARVLAAADDTVTVWAVERDMGAGDTVTAGDLVPRRVRFGDTGGLARYFSADSPLRPGLQLSRGVGAGELLPRSALGPTGEEGLVQLPVAVDAELVPPAVVAGSLVDLYVLPSGGGRCAGGRSPGCAPVLERVTVVSASSVDEGFGASGQRQLVLGVAEDQASGYFETYGATDGPVVTVVRRG